MLRSFDGNKWPRNEPDHLNRCKRFSERNSGQTQ